LDREGFGLKGFGFLTDLILGQDFRKSERLTGIKAMGNHIGRRQYVFENENAILGSSRKKGDRQSYFYPYLYHVLF